MDRKKSKEVENEKRSDEKDDQKWGSHAKRMKSEKIRERGREKEWREGAEKEKREDSKPYNMLLMSRQYCKMK